VRHLAANGIGGEAYRTSPLDDQLELYDLAADPTEGANRWTDPDLHDLRAHLRMQLKQVRTRSVPERNQPWPYASRRPPGAKTQSRQGWRVCCVGLGPHSIDEVRQHDDAFAALDVSA
jgi:hypothetical protein